MFRTLKDAEAIVGKLSKPSKMPGYAYGIPAKHCKVGSILTQLKGSVCASCYALKGRYSFPTVQNALERRFASLQDPRWVSALTFLISSRDCKHFRWHDSGDLQGLWHLDNIVAVANNCPGTQFWLPTRERQMVKQWLDLHPSGFPPNLVVRVSGAMIDGPPPSSFPHTSTVVSKEAPTCPAYQQGGMCGSCRACWNPSVRNVSYPKH